MAPALSQGLLDVLVCPVCHQPLVRRHPVTTTVVLLVAAFTICMVVAPGGESLTGDISNIGTVLIAVAAGVACLVRAGPRPGRMRWAWFGIALGTISYGIGEGIWTWIQTVQRHEVPFPSA